MQSLTPFRSFLLPLGTFVLAAPAMAQVLTKAQCTSLQAQYDALVADMNQTIGCTSSKPAGPKMPLRPIDESGSDPNEANCNSTSQQAERAGWMASHPQFKKIQNELTASCWPKDPCASSTVAAATLSTDLDDDGIPDLEEAALIRRFAPYVRYNKGEDRRPMDFTDFVSKSNLVTPNHYFNGEDQVFLANKELAQNPLRVETFKGYEGTSLIDSFYLNTDGQSCSSSAQLTYAIHPYVGDWEGGVPWSQISNSHMPGMVAHVSPFVPNSLSDLAGEHFEPGTLVATAETCALSKDKDKCPDPLHPKAASCSVIPPSRYIASCKRCIKIEYYQFFGLNDDHHASTANHEGDLSIVTVVYDPDHKPDGAGGAGAAVGISHWIHGIEVRYDLTDPASNCILQSPEMFCKGSNGANTSLSLIGDNFKTKHLNQIALAQNNFVIFHADLSNPNQTNPEHPEVFPELGSHEFWPSQEWHVEGGNDHNGDDTAHSYLPQNIPNLGEIEHPLGELGKLVVNFKGYWGATGGNSLNPSSPGPSLHTTWNWFVHSPRLPISCLSAEN